MPTKRRLRLSDAWLWVAALAAAGLCIPQAHAHAPAKSGRHALKPEGHHAARGAHKKQGARGKTAPVPKQQAPLPLDTAGGPGIFGAASFYGFGFQGRRVATGERFDVRGMTAACNHVPLGTWVAVRRSDTGACVIVKVNDRMHTQHRTRVIDLSRAAAERLRMIAAGVVLVRIAPLAGAPHGDPDRLCQAAFAGGGEEFDGMELPMVPPKLPNLYDLLQPGEPVETSRP